MASQPDVLHSCLQQAAKAARPALERCIENAVAALQIAETQSLKMAERDALAVAWRELLKNKPAWCAQYPADLLAAFSSGLASTKQAVASTHAFASHDAFSLVDDADVSQAIESSRLLQKILPLVEQPLAELDALISAVQGLPNVRPELNPLRPELFAQTLRAMIFAASSEPAISSLWLKCLADPLGRELTLVYEQLVNQLELAKVRGAGYQVRQTPVSGGKGRENKQTGPGSACGNGGASMAGIPRGGYVSDGPMAPRPSQYADLSDPEIKDGMFHDFLLSGGSNANRGLAPAYYATMEEELLALKAARESALAPLTGSSDAPQAGSQLSQERWGAYGRPRERDILRTQLKKDARQVGQVLGLEVVRKLVEQVAQDSRLLVPVREAIVALEPSLLRLAMVDPRFFSDEGHAGRRLIERVAQRSFKYNDEFSPEFLAFFEPVARAFNALNDLAIDDAQPFGMALAQLGYGWNEQDQLEAKNRDSVLQTLRFAEERQTQADQIAFELSSRSDLEKVPGRVLDFLFGPWSLAMAHARLADTRNQVDPLGFGSVVPDLLWSVKQEVTLQRPAKLIEMIPGLLGKLHSGLDLLGQDPRENEEFFEMLMQLHQPVLKLRRLKSQRDAEESGLMALESGVMPLEPEEAPASTEQRRAKAAALPWLGRSDLDAAGFEDTLPTAHGELAPAQPPTAAQDGAETNHAAAAQEPTQEPGDDAPAGAADINTEITPAQAEQTLLSLRAGRWVDLYSKHRWRRAQLIWASTKGTLFMFVSHGGQPHSMTKRSCERLIRERLLRPVDSHGVVAQALDAVASQLAATAPAERETT